MFRRAMKYILSVFPLKLSEPSGKASVGIACLQEGQDRTQGSIPSIFLQKNMGRLHEEEKNKSCVVW